MTPMAAKSGPGWKTRAAIGAAVVVCVISYPAQVGRVLLAIGHGAGTVGCTLAPKACTADQPDLGKLPGAEIVRTKETQP